MVPCLNYSQLERYLRFYSSPFTYPSLLVHSDKNFIHPIKKRCFKQSTKQQEESFITKFYCFPVPSCHSVISEKLVQTHNLNPNLNHRPTHGACWKVKILPWRTIIRDMDLYVITCQRQIGYNRPSMVCFYRYCALVFLNFICNCIKDFFCRSKCVKVS